MGKERAIKTLAMRVLEGAKIPYDPLSYEVEGHLSAPEVAKAVGILPEQTFKTLVVFRETPHSKAILALVPGDSQLDLRKLAVAADEKRVRMAPQREAEQITGLKKGGISPLALLDKGFDVFVDETAILFDRIEISAGKVGVGVLAPVEPLIALLGAHLVDLSSKSEE